MYTEGISNGCIPFCVLRLAPTNYKLRVKKPMTASGWLKRPDLDFTIKTAKTKGATTICLSDENDPMGHIRYCILIESSC
jgi:hypothetical protein